MIVELFRRRPSWIWQRTQRLPPLEKRGQRKKTQKSPAFILNFSRLLIKIVRTDKVSLIKVLGRNRMMIIEGDNEGKMHQVCVDTNASQVDAFSLKISTELAVNLPLGNPRVAGCAGSVR